MAGKKDAPSGKNHGPAGKKDGAAGKKDGPPGKKDGPAVKEDDEEVAPPAAPKKRPRRASQQAEKEAVSEEGGVAAGQQVTEEVAAGQEVPAGQEVEQEVAAGEEVPAGQELAAGDEVPAGQEVAAGQEVPAEHEETARRDVAAEHEEAAGEDVAGDTLRDTLPPDSQPHEAESSSAARPSPGRRLKQRKSDESRASHESKRKASLKREVASEDRKVKLPPPPAMLPPPSSGMTNAVHDNIANAPEQIKEFWAAIKQAPAGTKTKYKREFIHEFTKSGREWRGKYFEAITEIIDEKWDKSEDVWKTWQQLVEINGEQKAKLIYDKKTCATKANGKYGAMPKDDPEPWTWMMYHWTEESTLRQTGTRDTMKRTAIEEATPAMDTHFAQALEHIGNAKDGHGAVAKRKAKRERVTKTPAIEQDPALKKAFLELRKGTTVAKKLKKETCLIFPTILRSCQVSFATSWRLLTEHVESRGQDGV